ncbi:MAG: sigma factor-like helix-turn-helix DNA-binding protein, partial [Terriglobales bacterium]
MRAAAPSAAVPARELRLYRDRTRAILRRYFRMSIELGRLPSLVGREFFRSRVTSYRMHTFEDAVIFVHDTESCLQRLDPFSQQLIARIVFQDYTLEEAAALVGCGRRTVVRRYPRALDRLSELFLGAELLRPIPCQEGES